MTPLHIAASKGYAEIVQILLKAGANYMSVDAVNISLNWSNLCYVL